MPIPAAILLLAVPVLAAPLSARPFQAPGGDTLQAHRIPAGEEAPRLDGLLSEEIWQAATPVSGFRQREPDEGRAATEDTEVRILFDADNLYVGIVARDSRPEGIVSRILQRDRVLNARGFGGFSPAGDDVVALLLDTYDDQRSGVVLATNPNGARFDALVTDDGDEINADWRGIWEVEATRIPEGWSAEFAIPWRSLRFTADQVQVWGINVTRFVQRTQEESMWRSWERDGGGFERVSKAGRLVGMANLPRPSMNLEAKPFLLAGRREVRLESDGFDRENELDAGIDLKSEVVPGVVLDLTYNTDFAQVEVDDEQVNLTRFSLFFPEKRDFFLENAGIFEFGQRGFGGPPPYLMFFSRRIGIGEDGEVPILGGGRVTGRVGGQSIGFLSIATDRTGDRDREIFNVARVKRDVGESAYIGFMATDRRGVGDANTVAGMDFQFYPHRTVQASGFASRSSTEGVGGEGWVYQGSVNWTQDLWGGFVQFLNIDPGVVARSGFVTRTDIRQSRVSLRRTFRPDVLGIRRMDLRNSGLYQSTVGGGFQDWNAGPSLSVTFDSGDNISLSGEWGDTELDDGFRVADSVAVPAGRYTTDEVSLRARTSNARPWSLSGNVRRADFFGGELVSMGGDLTVTPSPAFSFTAGITRNDADLPAGEFVADILSFRASWAASTRMVTDAVVQYNRLTDDILTNVRFNFIHRPGSDVFLVLTDERGVDDDLWALADRGLVAKLTYLVRF